MGPDVKITESFVSTAFKRLMGILRRLSTPREEHTPENQFGLLPHRICVDLISMQQVFECRHVFYRRSLSSVIWRGRLNHSSMQFPVAFFLLKVFQFILTFKTINVGRVQSKATRLINDPSLTSYLQSLVIVGRLLHLRLCWSELASFVPMSLTFIHIFYSHTSSHLHKVCIRWCRSSLYGSFFQNCKTVEHLPPLSFSIRLQSLSL